MSDSARDDEPLQPVSDGESPTEVERVQVSPEATQGVPGGAPTGGGDGRPWAERHLAAIIGLVGVLLGALLTGGLSLWTQQLNIDAVNAQSQRQTISQVYFEYLNAADTFNSETVLIINYARSQVKSPTDKFNLTADVTKPWTDARSKYQDAVNRLYAFGSDDAWKVHQRLAAALPTATSTETTPLQFRHDAAVFSQAFKDFLSVVCREAVASPRQGCGQ